MLSSSLFNLSKCGRQKDQQTSNHLDNKRWDWDTHTMDFLKSFFVLITTLGSLSTDDALAMLNITVIRRKVYMFYLH